MKRLLQALAFGLGLAAILPMMSITPQPLSVTWVNSLAAQRRIRFRPRPQKPPSSPNTRRIIDISTKGCPEGKLIALIPQLESAQQFGGITTLAHPTLWVSVPYSRQTGAKASLSLQDQNGKPIYSKIPVELPETPGIIPVPLPSTTPPLETNKLYLWYFTIKCDDSADNVQGWIQRIKNDSPSGQVKSSLEKAMDYAGKGIWYDALAELGNLRRNKPTDPVLEDEWKSLLEQIGLQEVSGYPIANFQQ